MGANSIRRCKSLTPNSHCSSDRSIPLTPIIPSTPRRLPAPSLAPYSNPVLCAFHLGFGLGPPAWSSRPMARRWIGQASSTTPFWAITPWTVWPRPAGRLSLELPATEIQHIPDRLFPTFSVKAAALLLGVTIQPPNNSPAGRGGAVRHTISTRGIRPSRGSMFCPPSQEQP